MELVRISREGAPYQVLAMCNARGDCEVFEFLRGLDKSETKLRRKILALLRERVPQRGVHKNNEESEELEDGINAFRPLPIRIFWFWDKGNLIVCAYAIRKKRKKASREDIEKVKAYREEYKVARDGGELAIRSYQGEIDEKS